jgi:hypothetical protein
MVRRLASRNPASGLSTVAKWSGKITIQSQNMKRKREREDYGEDVFGAADWICEKPL